jgi:hypothetical protein
MATIVGIGPKDFLGIWPGNPADLFVPVTCGIALAPELSADPLDRTDREIFRVVFRLARGATMPMAEAALNAVTRNFDRERGIQRDHDRVLRLMPAGTVMYATPNSAGSRTRSMSFFGRWSSRWCVPTWPVCCWLAAAREGGKSPFVFR